MPKIIGEVDLRQIPKEDFSSDQELRVAVVREGNVLGSTTLKASQRGVVPFEVSFEAVILPGAHLPCPVRIIVGPNVDDLSLLGLSTLSVDVDLSPSGEKPRKSAAGAAAEVKVGQLLVTPELYHCWLICCSTYVIRGRVVCRHWHYDPATGRWTFCDEAVPGATVDAFDVDCFLWWCRRDLIKSVTTDINGYFTIKFTWCCFSWHPWLRPRWAVDSELLDRIQKLLAASNIPLPPVPPGPEPDPIFLQELASNAAAASLRARPSSLQSTSLAPSGVVDSSISMDALQSILPHSEDLTALHVWPWWDWRDCRPDIVFRVTQRCEGRLNVIYSETNAQTRWNIPTTLNVTLLANNLACCIPTCRDPECPECLKLTWVGCTPADQIGTTAGPPDLRGYAYTGAMLDRPFYGSLQIRGGVGWDVDYIKVQYSFNGGAWTDLPVPAFGGFSRSYWDGFNFVAAPPPAFTPVAKNGQLVIVTRKHYETLHPAIPRFGGNVLWNDYDTLFYFDTITAPGLPDGLYQLRFVGYAADAADNLVLATARVLPTCGQESGEMVYIRIDNQRMIHPPSAPLHPCPTVIHACTNEPDCYIRKVCKNEGQPDEHCIAPCEILSLKATDTLTIHFSVTVPPTTNDGHLGGYWLRAEYGVSQAFYLGTGLHGTFQAAPTFEVGPDYASALAQAAPRPHWYGGHYKVTVRGADFPECCAYLLHLRAWKRTTNGCSDPQWVHANEFEFAFTVLRPELCPEVCPDKQ